MNVDWFTVIAQAVNFLLLVFLLRYFLYQPVLDAIDAREKRIADELAEAANTRDQAAKEHADYDQKNAEFDQQRAARMAEVEVAAAAERQRLLVAAGEAVDALRETRQRVLAHEARSLSEAVSQRTVDEVFAICRRVLADLASTSMEERIGAAFTQRLSELADDDRAALAAAIAGGPDVAVVRSAFDLPPDQRAVIENAFNETFSTEGGVRFETAPALISGIELTANGQKVGWSIAAYLGSLQRGVNELLNTSHKPHGV